MDRSIRHNLQSEDQGNIVEHDDGWDTVGPCRSLGEIDKGKPDEKNLAAAQAFAQGLKNKM